MDKVNKRLRYVFFSHKFDIHLKLNGGYNWLCKLGYHKGKIIRYVGTYFGLGGTTNGLIYKCERCQTEYTKLEQGVGGSYLCV